MSIRYTNKHGMPAALARAVELDYKHTAGDISVSQLISPPRIRQLVSRHGVEIDVSEQLWALMGKSVHKAIEDHVEQAEVQLVAEVDGLRVSGTIDEIGQGGILRDWKITSAWTYVFAGERGRQEWERQLNLYAWLCENAKVQVGPAGAPVQGMQGWEPIEVAGLRAVMIFRDFTAAKAGKGGYPDRPWHEAEIPLWPEEHRDAYLRHRIEVYRQAELTETAELPLCDPAERWVNERTGKETRCLGYCPARGVCDHALALQAMAT